MWPDIRKASLLEDIPSVMEKLPRTAERLKASHFFAAHTPSEWRMAQVDSDYQLQVKSWLNWASIVALPNPSMDDPLDRDFESIGLAEEWRKSEERRKLYEDPLIAVLLELRNYEVHFELRKGDVRNFRPLYGMEARPNEEPKEIDLGERFFIASIDYKSLSQTINIKSGKSKVTSEMIEWFNRQTSTWPAAYIIGQARERYTVFIAEFLKNNGIE